MSEHFPDLTREEIVELLGQNAEMRRLLEQNQWSGLTPIKSNGVCPECCGSSRHGQRSGRALAATIQWPPRREPQATGGPAKSSCFRPTGAEPARVPLQARRS